MKDSYETLNDGIKQFDVFELNLHRNSKNYEQLDTMNFQYNEALCTMHM